MKLCGLVCAVVALWMLASVDAMAVESRCTELGANCLCSDTLNAAGPLVDPGPDNYTWTIDDGATKDCIFWGGSGVIEMNDASIGILSVSSDATILSALPAGHSVGFFLKASDSYNGIWSNGHKIADATTMVRRSMRFYVYVSPNFQYSVPTANGTCAGNSGKIASFEMDGGGYFSTYSASSYSIANWGAGYSGQNPNCCVAPPGADAGALTAINPASVFGHWLRIEMVIEGEDQTPMVLKSYWRDVTANTATYKMLDTSIPTTMADGNDWTSTNATTLQHVGTKGQFGSEFFRTGSCPGYYAISHVMYAAWDTNAGQLIGAAVEVEGSGAQAYSSSFDGGFRMLGVTIR